MSAPHVVIQTDRKALSPVSTAAPKTAWRALGRVGLVLAVVAGFDIVLRWYPASFRSPEWEFGTVAMTFASLPLVTVGLVAGLASAMARGEKVGATAMAAVFCMMSFFVVAALLLFASDIPRDLLCRETVALQRREPISSPPRGSPEPRVRASPERA